jgi:hypothetical protein
MQRSARFSVLRCLLFLLSLCACFGAGPALAEDGGATVAGANFRVVTTRTAMRSWSAIRYEPKSGNCWVLDKGAWAPMPETGPVEPGNFEVVMIGLDGDWGAIRLDRDSGRSWMAQDGGWVAVSALPAQAPPAP